MTAAVSDAPDIKGSVRRRRWWQLALVALLVACLVAGILGVRWWRHPTAFQPVDSSLVLSGIAQTHRPENVGMSYLRDGVSPDSVTLLSARPHVLTNTSNATMSVHVCTVSPTAGEAIGMVPGDLSQWCSRVRPVDGASLTSLSTDGTPDQLVITIVATRPGTVIVQGLDVTYKHGWQRGSQRIGEYLRYRTP